MGCTHLPNVVLIPVLTGKENDKSFLLAAAGQSSLAVVVYLIDQASGMTGNEMSRELEEKEALLDEIDETLHGYGKRVKIYNEWGKWKEKIPVIAKREEVDELVVMKRGKMAESEIEILKELGIPLKLIGY